MWFEHIQNALHFTDVLISDTVLVLHSNNQTAKDPTLPNN
jgi:hypothetical protein